MLKLNIKLNTKFTLNFLLLAICSTLTACGTKGPLYIPEQRYPQGVEHPATPESTNPNKEKAPIIPPIATPPTVKDY
ncbi:MULTISPECIES: LPS translocon maturation chaperone LptM [Methylotenera]|uniref:LPS translocon maturation chaperone LptM n=1 Tax=Methylotenera TaxID=359407 RepID=UPI00037DE18C|nr:MULTISPECIES: lipoprotein [Methylotenera]